MGDLKSKIAGVGAVTATPSGALAAAAAAFYMMMMQFFMLLSFLVQVFLVPFLAFILGVLGIIAAVLGLFGGGGSDPCAAADKTADAIAKSVSRATGMVQQTATAQRIWFLLASGGSMSDMSVAALLGNVENESQFNPSAVNDLDCKGLFQQCFSRADGLVNYATTKNNGEWQDVDLQVEYMLVENHKGVPELINPSAYGLGDVGAISDYWGLHWEVFSTDLNDPEFAERREASERWASRISNWRASGNVGADKLGDYDAAAAVTNALDAGLAAGDSGATETAASAMSGAIKACGAKISAAGNAKAAELGIMLTDGHIRVGDNVNVTDAGVSRIDEWPLYKKAHQIAIPGDTLYASCDRYVSTVIRLSLDMHFPPGGTAGGMGVYMQSSANWTEVADPAESQPGDVWVKSPCSGSLCSSASDDDGSGHIMLFIGDYGGIANVIADASYYSRLPAVQLNSYSYYAQKSNLYIFRYTGKGEPVLSEFTR
ncbi:MAG: phage tail-type lysozyme domain-containing protein [Bifidobacteriaceae bacterium]|jgi:hypothetical protein|nr:phage tail-type lysozyme domain-containing protein [Bifidobacteriaceae bacterium]